MLIEEVKKLTPMEIFLYWIKERHGIYRKKEQGKPKPWTDDRILQSYSFCNVYRELDKTTVWFRENIREPLRDDPYVLFATICFRWFNLIETGEEILCQKPEDSRFGLFTKWSLPYAKKMLHQYKSNGNKVFTGAFNISNGGSTKPKIDRVCDDYVQPIWIDRENLVYLLQSGGTSKEQGTLAHAHKVLKQLPGLGGSGFMAAQIIADLRYTYLLENASDSKYWASIGPGSKRGLNRLNGRSVEAPIRDWQAQLTDLTDIVKRELTKLPFIHGQNVQNCLCEYSKYMTALHGDGHLKRRYVGC